MVKVVKGEYYSDGRDGGDGSGRGRRGRVAFPGLGTGVVEVLRAAFALTVGPGFSCF